MTKSLLYIESELEKIFSVIVHEIMRYPVYELEIKRLKDKIVQLEDCLNCVYDIHLKENQGED
tara:strand:- start:225 stop:413 length:189 start_codon:yes stop_codon:yes gene_type:complete